MASADGMFTSGQAEAMCKANPPSVVPRKKLPALEGPSPTPVNPCKPRERSDHPQLNCDDCPEAGAGDCRQQSRSKVRLEPWSLPALLEASAEANEECEREPAGPAEAEGAQWSCPACTFLNCSLMNTCEVCETEKFAKPPKDVPAWRDPALAGEDRPALQSRPVDDWPSLAEAADNWVSCEISSVASSWVDIEVAEAFPEDDDASAIIVSSATAPAPTTSWAAKAGAAAGPGAPAKAPMRRTGAPPLAFRAPATRQDRPEREDEDEEDPMLTCLEDRRLWSRASRGATNRRRVARLRR